jgi:secreted Zn-dependent insulinase-like peptidase
LFLLINPFQRAIPSKKNLLSFEKKKDVVITFLRDKDSNGISRTLRDVGLCESDSVEIRRYTNFVVFHESEDVDATLAKFDDVLEGIFSFFSSSFEKKIKKVN